jgi:hypothetical protein
MPVAAAAPKRRLALSPLIVESVAAAVVVAALPQVAEEVTRKSAVGPAELGQTRPAAPAAVRPLAAR